MHIRGHGIVSGLLAVGLAAVLLMSACKSDEGGRSGAMVQDTGEPALHAVHGARLREAMQDLNRQAKQWTRAEIYTGSSEGIDMAAVAQSADHIVETAGYIPEILKDMQLDETDQRVFLKMTDKLAAEAQFLALAAREQNLGRVRAGMERLNNTCNACHATFRLRPVDLQ